MSGVPAGTLTLQEAAQRYCAARAAMSPAMGTDGAHEELKHAFAERQLDCFVGPAPGVRLVGWLEEPFADLNFLRPRITSSAHWRQFAGQVPYVDEAAFDEWLARKRQRMVSVYWTADQALIWLATGDMPLPEAFYRFQSVRPIGRAACEQELLRILRSVEEVAYQDDVAVSALWFHGASIETVAGETARRLGVRDFATVFVRKDDSPMVSGQWQSTPIRGMAPWIHVERLMTSADRHLLPSLPTPDGPETHFPIGWVRLWIIQRGEPRTVLASQLDALLADAEAELFVALSQAPEKARACEVRENERLGDPTSEFLTGDSWSAVNDGIAGHAEFYAMDCVSDRDGERGQLGGTIVHGERRWTRIELERAWVFDRWPARTSLPSPTMDDAAPPRPLSTRKTRGFGDEDKPILAEMREMIVGNRASSATAAATRLVDKAKGGGTEVSKIRRLERGYHRTYGS